MARRRISLWRLNHFARGAFREVFRAARRGARLPQRLDEKGSIAAPLSALRVRRASAAENQPRLHTKPRIGRPGPAKRPKPSGRCISCRRSIQRSSARPRAGASRLPSRRGAFLRPPACASPRQTAGACRGVGAVLMHGAEPRTFAALLPHAGGGVTIVGGSSACGLPRGGTSGLLFVGGAKSPLQWMVMLFHGVEGANVPPRILGLVLDRRRLGEVLELFQSSPNLPSPAASACICFSSLVIGPPFTWRHSFTFFGPALSVPIRVVTLSGLQVVPRGPLSSPGRWTGTGRCSARRPWCDADRACALTCWS